MRRLDRRDSFQSEAHLYGSSRLGIKKYDRVIAKIQLPNNEIAAEEQLAVMVEDLRISEIHYDSPTEVSGQAMTPNNAVTETHTGEYIALYNISLEPMDLSDIVITESQTGSTHAIANGTTLQSGQTLLFAYGTPADPRGFGTGKRLS